MPDQPGRHTNRPQIITSEHVPPGIAGIALPDLSTVNRDNTRPPVCAELERLSETLDRVGTSVAGLEYALAPALGDDEPDERKRGLTTPVGTSALAVRVAELADTADDLAAAVATLTRRLEI